MLDNFESGIIKKAIYLDQNGVSVIIKRSAPSDNNSTRADFDTSNGIGKITLWESGDCDFELLDVNTEKTILWENQMIHSTDKLDEAINIFIDKLISHNNGLYEP